MSFKRSRPDPGHLLAIAAILASAIAIAHPGVAEAQMRSVDFFQGPVVSSGRVIGLGGAFIGVGEGAAAHIVNPASYAVRYAYSGDDWFDYDWLLSSINFGLRDGNALDLSGRRAFKDASMSQIGANVKLGRHGFGVQALAQAFTVEIAEGEGTSEAEYVQTVFGGGYAYPFLDGELTLGIMLTTGSAQLNDASNEELVGVEGEGSILGALWAPCGERWRLGGVIRGEITGREARGEQVDAVGTLVPESIVVPPQLGAGFSYMLGPRQYNVCPSYGDWEETNDAPPLRNFKRRYVLVAADLVLTGEAKDGIGAQSFLEGGAQRSGEFVTFSPRLGVESEVWSDVLVLRAGTYYEPSRFAENKGRFHGTFGFDVHVGELIFDWMASFVADLAPQYTNIGVGVGLWH